MNKSVLLMLMLWLVFSAFWVAEIVIHYYIIYPYLKTRGIHPALRRCCNFRTADMAAYKLARSSAGEPLRWWYVVRAMRILGWLLAIGFFYLLWSK